MRPDQRRNNQLRPLSIEHDFLTHPLASACIRCGGTRVLCAVSLDPSVPGWMRAQKISGGWVTSEYGMLPASTHDRVQRESTKGKPSGRTMEIQRLIGRSFRSVIDLNILGANTIYIDCDVLDADGGTRTASISGASAALWIAFQRMVKRGEIAKNPMKELVAAISVGIVNGVPCLDLCYEEDAKAEVDMNVVMTESGKFIEIQGTAEGAPFSDSQLGELLALARIGLAEIFKIQHQTIQAALAPQNSPVKPSKPLLSTLGDVLDGIKL